MVNNSIATNAIWKILETVKDPEVPVLSVVDLGVIRAVALEEQRVTVTITPTYTGCPAMDMISMHIKMALNAAGYQTTIQTVLSPAWTTDWMTENGKQQLKAYGIAPPMGKSFDQAYLDNLIVPCPQCNSTHTVLVSQFGSTACKALYKCEECKEPFDYFKCH
ncbi:MAG TPA: 1,2-phenylacetyl-CoA epoxidase subunit PaaD [Sediminibacterium sp.]|jgi:ring-1,2-phenylacetyl-CoA epoxidase subunit PaaD|uniref:1,2-phenylacetyl-CoA epoxidase subunit PaaD n=1 Tax=Sediminibacterium sp. TaxID=1917865 RepID=UPI0008AFA4A5|nr:1,2-phenylacetyl-CoA epoxidase subunit PaaD [Sediminibacterium sp.]OHC86129.1 MAG: phenylacetate-CoA oxygenase subunit PaaJ [Sphingobacteriia bacterium RIFOXYC2_FULL_35_18]OHC89642.1 MAG: phenylacetate-CoA oxygenase subunit PaaJ [Sphingobacteriia bacterium RIFOXYD2_FULL_35_12]OYY09191.1 MAG: phenylacetate-CoA oxygenase subunit PaaJ [Sphingobacteriia bacterium 35-36-14]OYZ52316.1 MAG: phenylacetate-CoA oxygenase subunit PaaJ [Sphingobacteriia bacterium 24-36-13]OZA62674.1 MAG: phenylacetate-